MITGLEVYFLLVQMHVKQYDTERDSDCNDTSTKQPKDKCKNKQIQ